MKNLPIYCFAISAFCWVIAATCNMMLGDKTHAYVDLGLVVLSLSLIGLYKNTEHLR